MERIGREGVTVLNWKGLLWLIAIFNLLERFISYNIDNDRIKMAFKKSWKRVETVELQKWVRMIIRLSKMFIINVCIILVYLWIMIIERIVVWSVSEFSSKFLNYWAFCLLEYLCACKQLRETRQLNQLCFCFFSGTGNKMDASPTSHIGWPLHITDIRKRPAFADPHYTIP